MVFGKSVREIKNNVARLPVMLVIADYLVLMPECKRFGNND